MQKHPDDSRVPIISDATITLQHPINNDTTTEIQFSYGPFEILSDARVIVDENIVFDGVSSLSS